MIPALGPFLAISVLVIVSPGPDTVLVLRNSLWGNRQTGAATAMGVVTGLATWSIAASAGIAALIRASEPAFVVLFFTTFLPQFVPAGSNSFAALLALGAIFCFITAAWLLLYAVVAARIASVLRRRRVQRAMNGITGVVLVGFGLRLATERR